MIDRIDHHADVLTLKAASYRLRSRGLDILPNIRASTTSPRTKPSTNWTVHFSSATNAKSSNVVDTHRKTCVWNCAECRRGLLGVDMPQSALVRFNSQFPCSRPRILLASDDVIPA